MNHIKVKCVAGLMLVWSLFSGHAGAQPIIGTPIGGWRANQESRTGFVQGVTYPASSVNIESMGAPALIQGRINKLSQITRDIASHSKNNQTSARKPALLIANGVPMPLSVEDTGSFARPYAFGLGSNSIEVRSPGTSPSSALSKSVQFYDAGKGSGAGVGRVVPGMRVVLSWTSDSTDLDLHVITPSGGHCFYGNRVLDDGSALDVDVTTGFGPEIWAAPAPKKGVYHVYVNYFGAGAIDDEVTIAQVSIITQEGSLHEKRQVFRVPLRKPGELMLVKSFVY
jgi:uncharacterized protein YfaP (DUF2135 family)